MQGPTEIAQVVLAIVLIGVILLQTKGSGWSGAMGGDYGSIYHTRRGLEKTLFQATIVLAVLFVIVSLLSAAIAG